MSPEVLEGATEFSAIAFRQIDVYAAALVIWEILSRTIVAPGGKDKIMETFGSGKVGRRPEALVKYTHRHHSEV